MGIPVFVLTYNELHLFEHYYNLNSDKYKDYDFYIIDNGSQTIQDETLEKLNVKLHFKSELNTGVSGGWNLIFKFAFKHYNFDKIVFNHDKPKNINEKGV